MRGRGACMVGSVCCGGMCGGGMCGRGVCGRGHAWQEIRPLQQAVRILLECILVDLSSTWRMKLN